MFSPIKDSTRVNNVRSIISDAIMTYFVKKEHSAPMDIQETFINNLLISRIEIENEVPMIQTIIMTGVAHVQQELYSMLMTRVDNAPEYKFGTKNGFPTIILDFKGIDLYVFSHPWMFLTRDQAGVESDVHKFVDADVHLLDCILLEFYYADILVQKLGRA